MGLPGAYYGHDDRQRPPYYSPGGSGHHYPPPQVSGPPHVSGHRMPPGSAAGPRPRDDDYKGVAESLISMGEPRHPGQGPPPPSGNPGLKRRPSDDNRPYSDYPHDSKRMAYSSAMDHHRDMNKHPPGHPYSPRT
ncbi:hypothetical protein H4R34_001280 [Dimargaris verticillata]|uniref:Uncharacterized protein n=1 Tax=Dimargaris verticillata TaxID=2761393 RepID=A0A9W8B6I5_9FUNG|nr:hypothetical protein H4R34_001280 [Dimargaris verticillata]